MRRSRHKSRFMLSKAQQAELDCRLARFKLTGPLGRSWCDIKNSRGGVSHPVQKAGLKNLVKDFQRRWGDVTDKAVKYCKTISNLDKLIEAAVFAIDVDGKRHSHQWRLTHEALKSTYLATLKRKNAIKTVRSFDELMGIIKESAAFGFGELAIYDTAHRIGARLKLHPKRVYLHRGTRDGAKALLLDTRSGIIEMKSLPLPLRVLSPEQIEDFLCMYKHALCGKQERGSHARGSNNRRNRSCAARKN